MQVIRRRAPFEPRKGSKDRSNERAETREDGVSPLATCLSAHDPSVQPPAGCLTARRCMAEKPGRCKGRCWRPADGSGTARSRSAPGSATSRQPLRGTETAPEKERWNKPKATIEHVISRHDPRIFGARTVTRSPVACSCLPDRQPLDDVVAGFARSRRQSPAG